MSRRSYLPWPRRTQSEHRASQHSGLRNLLRADAYVPRLEYISLDSLIAAGCQLVLLDRDNTLVSRETGLMSAEAIAWVAEARKRGIHVWLISNNIFARSVHNTASELGVLASAASFKPLPFALTRARRKLGITHEATWVIGDQTFTDCLAARAARLHCIQVEPLSQHDLPYTKVLRLLERLVVHKSDFYNHNSKLCSQ